MNATKSFGAAALALLLAGTTACDDFLNVNTDPNNPLVASPSNLLPSTVISTGFANGNEISRITSLLVQHVAGTGSQSTGQDVYNIRGGLDNQWQLELYAGVLQNAQSMIEAADRVNSPAYAGIGKLLKAYNFALVTDLWGDVPYSEALRRFDNLQPRFDRQEDIYKGNAGQGVQSLFDLVKEGLADLDKPSTFKPGATDDPVYAGDLAKWKKMGNTLLLKLANTVSVREPALAKAIIEEVLAKGPGAYIATNDEDFEVPYGSSVGSQNPIYSFNYVNRTTDLLLSQRLLDSMALRNDPRLPKFFTTTPTPTATTNLTGTVTSVGVFTGFQNGTPGAGPALANRSRYGAYPAGTSGAAPIRLLTNFQVLFIRAESAVMLGVVGDAQALLREAVRASMRKAGLTDADVDAYFAANPRWVTLTPAADAVSRQKNLNKIITQKWIAWVGNGYEAYNDYRRTGFPRLSLALNPQGDDGTLPKRFVYPASELSGNTKNAPSPVPGTSVPVWWDVD
ncbi:SusD/RagB family nutrient-binding outer membrane lipoprotein [Hymenobacter jeollabukensis]|uniref:SusD/RagB family nutrient-binding outer membrane lipoprotein n=1 Tax=Hymenobacter jeollabukensis TaxID=2025313 RepID=A0A5R8WJV1_9BACT|nr:SusD/RagB family nutrient-binding outer membrane lipoprotein [Hymenobacter jeollabukensis]TLM88912.1 SusD/RagB family nutrient-binding outer membrane lipoprotein [Hymenobacter jeollabukensis]